MDRETVKTGFELCANGEPCMGEKFIQCPFSPRNNAEQNCGVTMARNALDLLKEQEAVVHCGDCENFCFDNISPNAGRCMLTNMSHSKTWFCAHGKREKGR